MVEEAPGCPYPPKAANDQVFKLKDQTAIAGGGGTHLTFLGAATNDPATDLQVDLATAGAGYDASATWKRTDQSGTLAWTVKATISLARK
jgi:hypothetical protein